MRDWLGTFNIAEEGAPAYDEKVILFRGANAKTKFHITEHIVDVPEIPLLWRYRKCLTKHMFY
jgi:hypothetical protein